MHINLESEQRKRFLRQRLRSMGVHETTDGRKLADVSLYTLEWNYAIALNDEARAYGEE